MRRFAAVIAAAACLTAVSTTTGAAAACPNEALRIGPSALLPGCRAYELVSPAEKAGGNVASTINVHAAPDGEAASFYSSASFAGASASALENSYVARRGPDWGTEAIDPLQTNTGGLLILPSPANSRDLNRTLQVSKRALTPGAIEGGSNVYVRENPSGKLLLLAAQPGNAIFNQMSGFTPNGYIDGAPDWSHLMVHFPGELVAGAPVSYAGEFGEQVAVENIYDFVPGAEHPLRLINRLPDGEIDEHGAHLGGELVPNLHAMSEDGSRAYFEVGDFGEGPLYMREDDSVTYPVSESHDPATAGEVLQAEFGVASADGSTVYLTSVFPLLPGAEGGSLYRWVAPSTPAGKGTLIDVTPSAGPLGPAVTQVLGASQDGSYVYFAAHGALAEEASEDPAGEGVNIYVWHAGVTRLIAATIGGTSEYSFPGQWSVSPDGRTFALAASSPLTPEALPSPACPPEPLQGNTVGGCRQVYVYSAEAGSLRCVSCNGVPRGSSGIGGRAGHEHGTGSEYPHAVLDDGTVYFETPNPLVGRDSNGVGDVYAWNPSSGPELISTGTSEQPSSFGDATLNGGNVFFLTSQPLVKGDADANVDLYDDRDGGGLPSQWPPGAPGACEGEGCRGASSTAPSVLAPGSLVAGRDCTAFVNASRSAQARATRLAKRAKAVHGKGAAARKRARRLRTEASAAARRAKRSKQNAKSCGR
jgi:hypothetical protein